MGELRPRHTQEHTHARETISGRRFNTIVLDLDGVLRHPGTLVMDPRAIDIISGVNDHPGLLERGKRVHIATMSGSDIWPAINTLQDRLHQRKIQLVPRQFNVTNAAGALTVDMGTSQVLDGVPIRPIDLVAINAILTSRQLPELEAAELDFDFGMPGSADIYQLRMRLQHELRQAATTLWGLETTFKQQGVLLSPWLYDAATIALTPITTPPAQPVNKGRGVLQLAGVYNSDAILAMGDNAGSFDYDMFTAVMRLGGKDTTLVSNGRPSETTKRLQRTLPDHFFQYDPFGAKTYEARIANAMDLLQAVK